MFRRLSTTLLTPSRPFRTYFASNQKTQILYKIGDVKRTMQLKENESDSNNNPIPLDINGKIMQMSTSYDLSFFLTDKGLYASGSDEGFFGLKTIPTIVPELKDLKIIKVECGRRHGIFLTDEKRVYTCGDQELGQLGNGNQVKGVPSFNPVMVNTLPPVADIASGLDHSLVLSLHGDVFSWGFNGEGQLGIGVESDVFPVPKLVKLEKKPIKVYCGCDYSMALLENGQYYAWGAGDMGQLGNEFLDISPTPILVGIPGEKIVDLATGGVTCLGLTDKGEVYSWGHSEKGTLGHGNKFTTQPKPKKIKFFSNNGIKVTKISLKGAHCYALTENGDLYSWGLGYRGRLGHLNEEDVHVPKKIEFFKDKKVINFACGMDHTFVVVE